MALILLFENNADFRRKLIDTITECRDFIIRTRCGRDDTMPSILLDLLYRKLSVRQLEDYSLANWIDEKGRITIEGRYEGTRDVGNTAM